MNRLVALLLALSLAGCIVFDKKSEGVTFHQFTAQVAAPTTSQPLVFVPRATLPGPVRRPAVVIVTQGGEVQLDDSHRWAAPVDRLVADVAARHGHLDVMVNNAAIIDDSTPLTVTEAELDRVHAVNFKGVVFGSQAAARVMIPARSGSIITFGFAINRAVFVW